MTSREFHLLLTNDEREVIRQVIGDQPNFSFGDTTVLQMAAGELKPWLVSELLAAGADPNLLLGPPSPYNWTPLHNCLAAWNQRGYRDRDAGYDIFSMLLKNGAQAERDPKFFSALRQRRAAFWEYMKYHVVPLPHGVEWKVRASPEWQKQAMTNDQTVR